jgi:hypothetical protein
VIPAAAIAALVALAEPSPPAERWPGVDDAVVGRVAAEAGRRAWASPLEPEGDLKLFCFLVAGLVGGFALGYGWRELFGGPGGRGRSGRETAP